MALNAITRWIDGHVCVHYKLQGACQNCLEAFVSLFQRPFFRRLWVVQEVTLARSLSIFCRSKSTFWPLDRITRRLPVSV
ncbi:uncharacterized protein LY79DRAFT_558358 [Colletotrichum navitas]|uniref:Heterokaryon incompatibility domain-containing protein n=1 Tax=Colletotrichum navitas TaxID=681940 RepID=A0AAD8V367_9PEZI|nr:uncharacterized protein LY79DRAFT_558358 [Colletotrichum navitas]KAK1585563.1 hypothetical protein LY79DRAFT_558358 [Colletotrichum navitas]